MSEKAKNFDKLLKIDEEAREMCKPHGCRVMKCLSQNGMKECGPLITVLNICLEDKKK